MASTNPPIRGTAYTTYVSLVSQADTKLFKTSATLATGDCKVSKDGGSFNNIGTLPVEISTTGVLSLALTGTEMTADTVVVLFRDASGAEWCDLMLTLHTVAANFDALNTDIDAILADTAELQTDWVNGGRLDLILDARASQTSVDDLPTNAELATSQASADDATLSAIAALSIPTAGAIADAVWDEATTSHTTSGTFGEQVKTDVDAILADTNELQTDWANGGRLDLLIDATLADTAELQTDWVNGGRLDVILDARASQTSVDDLPTNAELATSQASADDATLAAMAALNNLSAAQVNAEADTAISDAALATAANLATLAGYVDTEVAAIKVVTDALTSAAATKLALSAGTIVTGNAITGTLSTTAFTTDLTEATSDHYNGRIVIFTSGVLTAQATDITDYDGATKTVTVTAMTEAPSNGDDFLII
jgi:hypothetical protein